MSYLLYLPGVTTGGDDAFARLGLYDLVKDGGPFCSHGAGPDGGHGLLAAWGSVEEMPELTWREETQEWLEVGAYWLGKNGRAIEPRTLARATQKAGIWVELADGKRWLIPVARQLPHLWGVGADGEPGRTPAKPFAEFCATSRRVYETFAGSAPGEGLAFTDADGWKYVCQALAINYHVNPNVVSFLGIIDDDAFVRVLTATIEIDIAREVESQKKTGEQPTPAG